MNENTVKLLEEIRSKLEAKKPELHDYKIVMRKGKGKPEVLKSGKGTYSKIKGEYEAAEKGSRGKGITLWLNIDGEMVTGRG